MAARKRIFEAVFPSTALTSAPTPPATPILGSGSFSGSPGGFEDANVGAENSAAEKIKWERSWHTATSFLSLPKEALTLQHATSSDEKLLSKWLLSPLSTEGNNAIHYLVSEKTVGYRLREGRKEDDLWDWYTQEVAEHYIQYQLPILSEVSSRRGSIVLAECSLAVSVTNKWP